MTVSDRPTPPVFHALKDRVGDRVLDAGVVSVTACGVFTLLLVAAAVASGLYVPAVSTIALAAITFVGFVLLGTVLFYPIVAVRGRLHHTHWPGDPFLFGSLVGFLVILLGRVLASASVSFPPWLSGPVPFLAAVYVTAEAVCWFVGKRRIPPSTPEETSEENGAA